MSYYGYRLQLSTDNDEGYLQNSLSIKNKTIITDITKDIPFIEANFKTSHFLGYNDNLD